MSPEQVLLPHVSLERRLDDLFADAARRAFGDDVEFASTVHPSKHADYQVNGALALAKKLGRPPRDVATDLVAALAGHDDVLESVEIAGPGFVNCTFAARYLSSVLGEIVISPDNGIEPQSTQHTYVVDYSSPNIAKNMHVGHLRTTIIGDTLVRLMAARHNNVVRQNHVGDWGTQFGMLIEHLLDSDDVDSAAAALISDLDALYREARVKFDNDEAFARRSRERVVLLQDGDPKTLELWQKLVDTSQQYFVKVYSELGVLLTEDDNRGESFYNNMLDGVVDELQQKGMLHESDGALVAYPPGFSGRDGEPFALIVRKSDGGYGYVATDLATLRHNIEEYGGDRLVYVTDVRQGPHFHQVFAVARQAGWVPDNVEMVHVGYGMVMGDDGKPFKTRSGEVVQLIALLEEAIERAHKTLDERESDLSSEDRTAVARAVGIGAVKWFDLKNEHTGNYVFDFDRMLAFKGNTGPYVQYASTRAKSVLRKAGVGNPATAFDVVEEAERQLALHLSEFGSAVHRALEEYEPHKLCTYLFELAERYSTFYEQCPILGAEDSVRTSRLALCALTARVLDRGMSLLGITPLEKM
jgi:arginyl-tRNA synthetase